jgi:hypothetical protein
MLLGDRLLLLLAEVGQQARQEIVAALADLAVDARAGNSCPASRSTSCQAVT